MKIIPIGLVVIELGMIVVTRRAAAQMEKLDAMDALIRHMTGDWGEIPPEACEKNEEALTHGRRVVSSYLDRYLQRFMVITDADRSTTTIQLPDEC